MYRAKLEKMKKKQLLEEADKFPGRADVKDSDTIPVIIDKLVLADISKPSKIEQYKTAKTEVSGFTKQYGDDYELSTVGLISEEELLSPEERAERELRDNYARPDSSPLKAVITGYEKMLADEGEAFFVIHASYGEAQREILVPFEEYVLEVRSEVVKRLASENANRANDNACETVDPKKMSDREIRTYIEKRAGTHFNFTVTDVDEDEGGYILGSRVKAAEKDKIMWQRVVGIGAHKGEYLIREGRTITCEIMAVLPYGIYVDIYGYEFFVPKCELEYIQRINLTGKYRPGQYIKLLIKSITRDEKGHFLKAALSKIDLNTGKTPQQDAAEKLRKNQIVFGTVIDREMDLKGKVRYYVLYRGCLQIACYLDDRLSINVKIGDEVKIKISESIPETGQARGYIQHVTPNFEAIDPKNWSDL